MYTVQRLNDGTWENVPGLMDYQSYRAIHEAQKLFEKTNQETRVVNERGAVVWPVRDSGRRV